jgi:hypothetical protein
MMIGAILAKMMSPTPTQNESMIFAEELVRLRRHMTATTPPMLLGTMSMLS